LYEIVTAIYGEKIAVKSIRIIEKMGYKMAIWWYVSEMCGGW